jgi:hypothetical protein
MRAHCDAPDDDRAGCDPHAFLNHDGLSNRGGAALRRFEGMTRCDDADIRRDHHIVRNVEAAKVVKSTVLINEDVTPDADLVPAGRIRWRDKQEVVIHLFADEFAEQGPNFVRVVERQTVEFGGDRHGSFDVGQHRRRIRGFTVNHPDDIVRRHSLVSLRGIEKRSGAPIWSSEGQSVAITRKG